ncbi:MAG: glycosyltransferase [Clostridiales bacterium]|nr:glycosyltransferase [Clostridiales bacterium]
MLRIGQFTDTFLPIVDGVGRVVQAYAENLSRMGHQVTVVAPMYDTGYQGGFPFELVDFMGAGVPGMKQYKVGEAVWDAHYRKRMRMITLDLIHAHSPFTAGSEAIRLAALRKLPMVATFHSKYYDDFLKATKSESIAKMGTKFVVNFYNRCDEVWAVGKNTADVLRGYGYEGEIQVMPNGATMRAATESDIREVTRRWNLGEDPMILFVGQMDRKKNILTVLEACAELKQAGRKYRLLLAGQGIDMNAIGQKIKDLNIQDRAEMLGHITDASLLDGLYARATVFAFPSLYDAAPMVVREAAVMGTPSVMVRGSTAAEIIRDRENGFLCENDPKDLARVLGEVINDPELIRETGEKARETIPVPWQIVLETAVERYTRLVALGKEGKLKDKRIRVI